jgi:lysophospholipase L1-like esterase
LSTIEIPGVSFRLLDISKDLAPEHLMDGLHPNMAGHRVLGNALYQELARILNL